MNILARPLIEWTLEDLGVESHEAWLARLRRENAQEATLDDPSLDTIEEAADRAITAEIERCKEEQECE